MRLLVYPHDLSIGGSRINASDLAEGAAAKSHEVIIYGILGPLVDYTAERGLRFIAARTLHHRQVAGRNRPGQGADQRPAGSHQTRRKGKLASDIVEGVRDQPGQHLPQ
jgi:hypothetical protein